MGIEGDICDYTDCNYAAYGYAQPQEGDSPQELGTQTIYTRTVIVETTITNPSFSKTAALSPREAPSERKAATAYNRTMCGASVQACRSVECGGELIYRWGGPDGPSLETGWNAKVRDDNGNYVKGNYSHKDDGTNEVKFSGGYEYNDLSSYNHSNGKD